MPGNAAQLPLGPPCADCAGLPVRNYRHGGGNHQPDVSWCFYASSGRVAHGSPFKWHATIQPGYNWQVWCCQFWTFKWLEKRIRLSHLPICSPQWCREVKISCLHWVSLILGTNRHGRQVEVPHQNHIRMTGGCLVGVKLVQRCANAANDSLERSFQQEKIIKT